MNDSARRWATAGLVALFAAGCESASSPTTDTAGPSSRGPQTLTLRVPEMGQRLELL